VRVSVFGLGYVGAVSCGCLAQDGAEVVGVDVNPQKAQLINEGRSPIIEDTIGDIVAEGVRRGRLRATTDVEDAIASTDVSLISVGTPSEPNGSLSLTAVRRVAEEIGAALARKSSRHVVVVRSTVLPGTVRTVVVPALEAASGREAHHDFGVCFNPEFLREGSSVKDYYNPPFTLIGRARDEDGDTASRLYAAVSAEVLFSSIETAEMVKYVSNAFHALKITFANEMGILAQAMGVDSHQVMDLFCRDTKLNISPKYLGPGFAFGGSCLPKDLRALLHKARQNDLHTPLVSSILESNRAQIERAVALVVSLRKKRVSILGLSFKAGTDDLRESPLVTLTETLIGKGFDIRIYDSNIALARLVGANREYIEKEIPHISSLLVGTLHDAVTHGDVLVVGNAAPEFAGLPGLCRAGQTVLDLVRVEGLAGAAGIDYRGIVW
jgi:GDP-mannose 6-dehydrogenase